MSVEEFKTEALKYKSVKSVLVNNYFIIVEYVNGWARFPKQHNWKMLEIIANAKANEKFY